MKKTVSIRVKFWLFISVALTYCICSLIPFYISSISAALFFTAIAISFDFWVNHKFNIPHYKFMFASLAPVIVHVILFNFKPTLFIDGTFLSLIVSAFRIFLSIIDFIKTKKYGGMFVSIVLSVILFKLSFIVDEYQHNILRELVGFEYW